MKLEDFQTSATGAIAALPSAASALVPKAIKPPVGSATAVYTRVARGALTCWMGGDGGMRATHLFQADAKPPSAGGAAQIDIHERIADRPNQPGRRIFTIAILPVGEGASVTAENLGLPAPRGDAMRADVERWAADVEGCLEEPITPGWTPPDAASSGVKAVGGAAVKEPGKSQPAKPAAHTSQR